MRCISVSVLVIISCFLSSPVLHADETIYSNTVFEGGGDHTNTLFFDYGITTGGMIKKIRIVYSNSYSSSNWVRLTFCSYFSKTYYEIYGYLDTILINNLPLTYGGYSLYEYVLPEEDRFVLPAGSFGFTAEMSSGINWGLASGGAGNEDVMWQYDNDWEWWMPFWYGGDPWAGLYLEIIKGPPIDEITCDISGYKFDDQDGDGTWDPGEPAMPGWEVYLDLNDNGQKDPGEPNSVTNDPNGMYFFENIDPGTYVVREIMKSGWTQTLPGGPDNKYVIHTEPNFVYPGYDFGNTTNPTKYGGGDGTEENPYLITTAAHLQQLGATPADWVEDIYFQLAADINMSAYTGTSYNMIGTDTAHAFRASFDGNNHTISNFSYSTTAAVSYVGLFGCFDGRLTDLKMTNVSIYAPNADYVGAITGYLGGWILQCRVESGAITGHDCTGGIAGRVNLISNRVPAVLYACSKCAVQGNLYVGGLAGSIKSMTIHNCYSNSPVTGQGHVGGLLGQVETFFMIVENSYASGGVTAVYNKGGLVGTGPCKSIRSFWDSQTTNCSTSGAGESKTTIQMKEAETFAGWGCSEAWTLNAGVDYPRFVFETLPGAPLPIPIYGGGSGTEEDPYLIYTAEQFNDIGKYECHSDAYFKLMADIEFSPADENNFIPAGCYHGFSGSFDGGCHVIRNPYYIEEDPDRYFLGIFAGIGTIYEAGEVKNLGVLNPYIFSAGEAVGGICGSLDSGTIRNCFVLGGSFSAAEAVGGLTGNVGPRDNRILNCYTRTSVIGDAGVGGLTGYYSDGLIDSCYAAGPVEGTEETGGLVGYYFGGDVTNSYYDEETTGQTGG